MLNTKKCHMLNTKKCHLFSIIFFEEIKCFPTFYSRCITYHILNLKLRDSYLLGNRSLMTLGTKYSRMD